jgi:hypothetical protein
MFRLKQLNVEVLIVSSLPLLIIIPNGGAACLVADPMNFPKNRKRGAKWMAIPAMTASDSSRQGNR